MTIETLKSALEDIAKGMVPSAEINRMLELPSGKGTFHEEFSAWMQRRARTALEEPQ